MKVMILLLALSGWIATAQTDDEIPSFRSRASDRALISATIGIQGNPLTSLLLGGDYQAGAGSGLEVRARILQSWGLLGEWHKDSVTYSSRHQSVRMENSLIRLGAFYRVTESKKNRFWRGAHLDVHAGIQYGRSVYHVNYDSDGRDQGSGRESAAGARAGADFFFPGFFHTWIFSGGGLELNGFNYDNLPEDPGGDGKPNPQPYGVFFRIGAAVSF